MPAASARFSVSTIGRATDLHGPLDGRGGDGAKEVLRDLAAVLPGPFGLLYVLTLSRRGDAEAGRYQSPHLIERSVLDSFLERYRAFLNGDGRHALWIFSAPDRSTLVYDRHNVLYAYGSLDRFREVAAARGMTPGPVRIPSPHSHSYNVVSDDEERRVLQHCSWKRSPLQAGDDD